MNKNELPIPFTPRGHELMKQWEQEDMKAMKNLGRITNPIYIEVDGRTFAWHTEYITFEHVVELAGEWGKPSCIWQSKDGRSGILGAGRDVKAEAGMRFSLAHTGDA